MTAFFDETNEELFVATDKGITIWKLLDQPARSRFIALPSKSKEVTLSPDGRRLIVRDECYGEALKCSFRIRFIDIITGVVLYELSTVGLYIAYVTLDPHSRWLAAVAEEGDVYLWSISSLISETGVELAEAVCRSVLLNEAASTFEHAELEAAVLAGNERLRNPCRRVGPLSWRFWLPRQQ
jgi:hypothetical protein